MTSPTVGVSCPTGARTPEGGIAPAILSTPLPDGSVRCDLCAHRCLVRPGRRGICGVRENRAGSFVTPVSGGAGPRRAGPDRKKAALSRPARHHRLLDRDPRLQLPLPLLPELGHRPGAARGGPDALLPAAAA